MRRVGAKYHPLQDSDAGLPSVPELTEAPIGSPQLVPAPQWARPGMPFWGAYRWTLAASSLAHAASGAAATALTASGGVPGTWSVRLCAPYADWASTGNATAPFVRTVVYKHVGDARPMALVAASFYITAACQAPAAIWFAWYQRALGRGLQPLRWLDYAASTAVMLMAVAMLVGVDDFWALLLLVGTTWSVAAFGLLQEQALFMLRTLQSRGDCPDFGVMSIADGSWAAYMAAHLCSWVPFSLAWAVLAGMFQWSLNRLSGMPDTLKAVPLVQLVLFVAFGVNQYYGTSSSLFAQGPGWRWTYMHSEVTFTALSVLTKSALAWMLYAGLGQRGGFGVDVIPQC